MCDAWRRARAAPARRCQTGAVDRPRAASRSPLAPFAALSLALHAGAWGLLRRASEPLLPAFDPTAETVAGDTLDVDPSLLAAAAPEETAPPAERTAGSITAPLTAETGMSASPAAPNHARHAAPASGAPPGPPPVFGAVGVRFAADLATTFTRAFPQAASADPLWTSVPFGAAGTADVTLVLDDEGRLAGSTIGGSPSPALRRGIDRTLVLLRAREFTARAPVTRLRVRAHVSRDDVHDGLHGDVFALSGGSFSGDVGTAFFALPPSSRSGGGRRVDVEVELAP